MTFACTAWASAVAYRASLLHAAAALIARPDLSLGLAVARATNLSKRLAWIDGSAGRERCVIGRRARRVLAVATIVGTAILGAVSLERQGLSAEKQTSTAAQPLGPSETGPDAIEIVVVGKDSGKRLAGAIARFSVDFGKSIRNADGEGVVRFNLTKRTFKDTLSFDVWADGYIQQRYFFAQSDVRYPRIPDRFTVELLPGEETLGGKVTDEQGKPIAGVTVTIWGYLGEKKDKHELAWMVEAKTDERGQWRCRCFRSMTFAYLYLSHPNFLSDEPSHPREHGQPGARGKRAPGDPPPNQAPLAALRDFSDVQVMTVGVSLAGKVTDLQGKPIAGAEVGWLGANWRHTFHEDMPVTGTDTTGRFRFPHVRPGEMTVLVKAKGYAPALKPLDEIDKAGHLTIELETTASAVGANRGFGRKAACRCLREHRYMAWLLGPWRIFEDRLRRSLSMGRCAA